MRIAKIGNLLIFHSIIKSMNFFVISKQIPQLQSKQKQLDFVMTQHKSFVSLPVMEQTFSKRQQPYSQSER